MTADVAFITSGGVQQHKIPEIHKLLEHLGLQEEDFDDVIVDDAEEEILEGTRCLAIMRVHIGNIFRQLAFYSEMRGAWNLRHVQEARCESLQCAGVLLGRL
jgi:hypothetical protein